MKRKKENYDLLIDKTVDKETYEKNEKDMKIFLIYMKIIDCLKYGLAFLLGVMLATLV